MIEFFCEPGAGTPLLGVLYISHRWAILSILLGLSIYYEIQKKQPMNHGGKKK